MYEIHDALYGDIVLSEEEANLLNTWEVQRLRRIFQLGLAHLTFPNGVHTRFEHSLGTRFMVEHIIKTSRLSIDEEDIRCLYFASLLHDISHPVLSHVTERLNELGYDIPSHEIMGPEMISGTFRKKVIKDGFLNDYECSPSISDLLDPKDKDRIIQILTGNNLDKPYLKDLIDGPIDADNLDYLRRDAYHIGLPRAFYDDRIYSSFVIGEKDGKEHILFRDSSDTISAILSVLEARFWLTKIVYRHHTTLIGERMFLEALDTGFNKKDALKLFSYGDEEFFSFFKNQMREKKDKETLKMLTDITNRRLYKRAFVTNRRFNEKTLTSAIQENERTGLKDVREEIARKAELNIQEILIDPPKPSKWKEDFDVLLNSDQPKTLSNYVGEELKTLKEQYKSTEIFAIYLNSKSKDTINYSKKISDYCKRRDWEGYYEPKDPLEVIANKQYKVKWVIDDVRKEKKASLDILKTFMETEGFLTRKLLGHKNSIKETTVSQYIGYLEKKFKTNGIRIFDVVREGGAKKWKIKKEIKNHLKMII